jgi:hypothetical protein
MNPYNLAQEDASLSVHLQLEGEPAGKEYAVSQFNMVFTQSMDDKGEPQDFVRGGRMLLTIKELVSENVHLWAIKEQTLKEGEIVFSREGANAALKIKFKNAYCIGYDRDINAFGGVATHLTISPEQVWLNDTEFYNRWLKN